MQLTTLTEPIDLLPTRPLVVMMPLEVPSGSEPLDMLMGVASSDPTATVIDLNDLVALRSMSTDDISDRMTGELNADLPHFGITLDPPDGSPDIDGPAVSMTSTRVRYPGVALLVTPRPPGR